MKAHIEFDWPTDEYHIHLVDHNCAYVVVDGRLAQVKMDEGARRPEPTLRLQRETLEVLLRAAGSVLQASDATVDALNDTRAVRDRLFALVEKLTP